MMENILEVVKLRFVCVNNTLQVETLLYLLQYKSQELDKVKLDSEKNLLFLSQQLMLLQSGLLKEQRRLNYLLSRKDEELSRRAATIHRLETIINTHSEHP